MVYTTHAYHPEVFLITFYRGGYIALALYVSFACRTLQKLQLLVTRCKRK